MRQFVAGVLACGVVLGGSERQPREGGEPPLRLGNFSVSLTV